MNPREEKDSGRWEVGPSSAMKEIWWNSLRCCHWKGQKKRGILGEESVGCSDLLDGRGKALVEMEYSVVLAFGEWYTTDVSWGLGRGRVRLQAYRM